MACRFGYRVDYDMLLGSVQYVEYAMLASSFQTADCFFEDCLTR